MKYEIAICDKELSMANQPNHSEEQNLFGLPVNRETIFSNPKNVYKKKKRKRQTKLIKKIPYIKRFLKEDEEILLITTGCSPTPIVEQLLIG